MEIPGAGALVYIVHEYLQRLTLFQRHKSLSSLHVLNCENSWGYAASSSLCSVRYYHLVGRV